MLTYEDKWTLFIAAVGLTGTLVIGVVCWFAELAEVDKKRRRSK